MDKRTDVEGSARRRVSVMIYLTPKIVEALDSALVQRGELSRSELIRGLLSARLSELGYMQA